MENWQYSSLTLTSLVGISIALGIGAALQGSVGYGMAMVASPILILIEPRLIPGPYLLASMLLSILMLLRERQSMDVRGLAWALVGRIPGTFLAGYLLAIISQHTLVLIFGGLMLLGVGISATGVRFPPKPGNLLFAGALSAIMGTLATLGGPPIALVYQDASSQKLRSTLSGYFFIGGIFSLMALVVVRKLGPEEVKLSMALLPGIVCGYLLSYQLLPLLQRINTRVLVLTIAAIAGVTVIVQWFI